MKILVADTFEQSGLDALSAIGCDVSYDPGLTGRTLAEVIRTSDADVLIVRSTQVTADMLDAGQLSLIVRAGAGVNTIDVKAASARGIYVSNCPGKNSIAVAELAFGLLLALDRRIPDNVAELQAGKWSKKEFSQARGLYGRTLGLLGYGSIGQEMARRAQGFGMHLVIWSRRFAQAMANRNTTAAPQLGLERTSPSLRIDIVPRAVDVAEQCDVLSVHVALTPDTRQLVGREMFARLRPGAYFINTARAEVVDQDALVAAIQEKQLRVALDVYALEPSVATGVFEDPIVKNPNVYGTHHIGASTDQAQEAIAQETVRIVRTYVQTGKVLNVVNLARQTPATHTLVVRHRDRPGVLAHVFDHLKAANINVQETENVVFDGAMAAVARINVDRPPDDVMLDRLRKNDDILDLHLVSLEQALLSQQPL